MLLLADLLDANEALAAGFLVALAEPDSLEIRLEILGKLLANAPLTLAATRTLMRAPSEPEEKVIARVYGSRDFKEGVEAFSGSARRFGLAIRAPAVTLPPLLFCRGNQASRVSGGASTKTGKPSSTRCERRTTVGALFPLRGSGGGRAATSEPARASENRGWRSQRPEDRQAGSRRR